MASNHFADDHHHAEDFLDDDSTSSSGSESSSEDISAHSVIDLTKEKPSQTFNFGSKKEKPSPAFDFSPKLVEIGNIPSIKDLYKKSKASCPCCITWSSDPQKRDSVGKTSADYGGYAVLARKTEGHGDYGKEMKLHSIVIQSGLIRDVLEDVLKGYPGVMAGLENLTVEAPFACFYHRWVQLNESYEKTEGKTKVHMKLLMELLEGEFEGTQKKVADLVKNRVLEHKYVWAVFPPGENVYLKSQGQDAVSVVESTHLYDESQRGGQKGWMLNLKHVDYNGSMTGYGRTCVKIPAFKGATPLDELPAIPFKLHVEREELERKLLARGEKWAELRSGKFAQYTGNAFTKDEAGYTMETYINGRVMVDPYAYFQFMRHEVVSLRPFGAPVPGTDHYVDIHHHRGPPPHMRMGHPPPPPPPPMPTRGYRGYEDEYDMVPVRYDSMQKRTRPDEEEQEPLDDEQKLICVPFVRGYCFKTKDWILFNIEYLSEITWTEDLFDNLVLPTEEKDLLLALFKSHAKESSTFDDFVIGKGKGMIILLDGPPGVGKTLTAESVAETMKAPLYTMSAGELGTHSDRVERKLSDVLEMATMWNAILLIDEADVFMEQRSPQDLMRNELVSIFLRQVEYFKGVMILTTNRVEMLDLAFDSRVDIRLHYPTLDLSARRQIWQNFIVKLPGGSNIWGADLDKLAALELNGRQIKSVMKTAHLLASGNGESVSFNHVKTVLRITRGEKL